MRLIFSLIAKIFCYAKWYMHKIKHPDKVIGQLEAVIWSGLVSYRHSVCISTNKTAYKKL